jgi:hypothetical protein
LQRYPQFFVKSRYSPDEGGSVKFSPMIGYICGGSG